MDVAYLFAKFTGAHINPAESLSRGGAAELTPGEIAAALAGATDTETTAAMAIYAHDPQSIKRLQLELESLAVERYGHELKPKPKKTKTEDEKRGRKSSVSISTAAIVEIVVEEAATGRTVSKEEKARRCRVKPSPYYRLAHPVYVELSNILDEWVSSACRTMARNIRQN